MKFLDKNRPADAAVKCDVGIRNQWKWAWLDESCDKGLLFETWCKKLDESGKCFCVPCGKIINHGSSGKKALRIHANNQEHWKNVSSIKNNSVLMEDSDTQTTTCSITNDANEIKAVTCMFLAEHCLPFSMAQELVDFAKRVSSNSKALQSLKLHRTAATYTTTHGVGYSIKQSLAEVLKDKFFSLNIDEATNNARDKVLNVLVQYFDEEQGKCFVQLLGSRVVNEANAQNIVDAISDILKERGLNWTQVVSVLHFCKINLESGVFLMLLPSS